MVSISCKYCISAFIWKKKKNNWVNQRVTSTSRHGLKEREASYSLCWKFSNQFIACYICKVMQTLNSLCNQWPKVGTSPGNDLGQRPHWVLAMQEVVLVPAAVHPAALHQAVGYFLLRKSKETAVPTSTIHTFTEQNNWTHQRIAWLLLSTLHS